ncbi:MAG: hypothetical protein E7267_03895 [Lachnospiraceae bacterium]|nr:hypothetical protein [Lachnospiraceae bacterium]
MMLPEINYIEQSKDIIEVFGGYNHTEAIKDGQFFEMTNLSADNYPVLSARNRREFVKEINKPNGLTYTDKLAYVDGTEFYYNSTKICDVSDSEKTMVSMGAYLCIFPDKIILNTETGNYFDMEAHYQSKGIIKVEPSTLNGSSIEYSEYEPAHVDGAYWLDEGVLKQWSNTYGMWLSVPTAYVRISEHIDGEINEQFTDGFEEGDTVTFEGFLEESLNGDFSLYSCENGYMVIGSAVNQFEQEDVINIDRTAPDMDFVCELNNRLWGCSSKNHEIYASKLGDPTNWRAYAGLVSDSYAVTVGSYGDFTGAIAHMGNVLFFKEGCVIKIYGTEPSNFTKTEIYCRGVEKGSEKSLAVLNEILYYKSKDGICAYDGTLPTSISADLGNERYRNAVAGVTLNKYYVSMQDVNGNRHLFVYDTSKGIWNREDDEDIRFFAGAAGMLYYMNEDSLNIVRTQGKGKGLYPGMYFYVGKKRTELYPGMIYPGQIINDEYEENIEWSCETGDMGTEYPDSKYISKIVVRVKTEGIFKMDIQYDSDGVWEPILDINDTGKSSITIPIKVRRCDHMKFRLRGTGQFRLYSISKCIEMGSEP